MKLKCRELQTNLIDTLDKVTEFKGELEHINSILQDEINLTDDLKQEI